MGHNKNALEFKSRKNFVWPKRWNWTNLIIL